MQLTKEHHLPQRSLPQQSKQSSTTRLPDAADALGAAEQKAHHDGKSTRELPPKQRIKLDRTPTSFCPKQSTSPTTHNDLRHTIRRLLLLLLHANWTRLGQPATFPLLQPHKLLPCHSHVAFNVPAKPSTKLSASHQSCNPKFPHLRLLRPSARTSWASPLASPPHLPARS